MKHVLCFGDSNSWGFMPGTEMERLPRDQRWPGVLAKALAGEVDLIEESLCGRTTSFDDPLFPDRNGARHLPMLLDSHVPLDGLVIMLGTNDLKHYFRLSPEDIALGVGFLVDLARERLPGLPVLLICPPPTVEARAPFGHKFDGSMQVSLGLPAAFREIAEEKNCLFFDAGGVATASPIDGVHLDAAAHRKLGEALAGPIGQLLTQSASSGCQ
jgi:lysophospholipase L1-like esterase